MTEGSVKRIMLTATIAAVALLTTLAIAGLLVITRGPQAYALPQLRTEVAATDTLAALPAETAPALLTDDRPARGSGGDGSPTEVAAAVTTASTTTARTATSQVKSGSSSQASPKVVTRTTTTSQRIESSEHDNEHDGGGDRDDHDREVVRPHIRETDWDED